MAGIVLTVDQQSLQKVIAAIKEESDGRKLRTELNRRLKEIAEPAVDHARESIQAMPTHDAKYGDMRPAIASKTTARVVATGRNTGVNIGAPLSGYPRNMRNAPRRYNSKGWRHPVFGNKSNWVTETGKPGWFDDAMGGVKEEMVVQIRAVLEEMTNRIAARATE